MKPTILIIGGDITPTGRCRYLHDALLQAGYDIHHKVIDPQIHGAKPGQWMLNADFSELEKRFNNAVTYGTSHPEMLKMPAADHQSKKREPKGPRNRWGKL